ncbi:tetratricopeptide repeat-containing serine protease family protein, partial [Trichocoleus sp. DQ-U1]|uniref:tetratricopeptide repeat-containing S1 family peptidase n=1 Tax=Trichocoleus sp. DQ-U1 TaxID=2933926 RepID=UPI003297E25B
MKHRKIVLIACSGIITAVSIGGIGLIGKKVQDNGLFAPSCAANQLTTADKVQQQAESITVKVFSGNNGGSGTLIAKQGQVYTVVTNQHVLTPGEPYRIQTPDDRIYLAEVVKSVNFAGNDLALLQFSSFGDNYAVASLATSSTLAVNDEVFAAGFPFDVKTLAFTTGKIGLLPDKALQGGYRIGYTNDIQKGMSGGPILNRQGELIGINGVHAYPLFGNPYVFQDGSKPSDTQREQITRSSWGVPIQTVVQAVPQLTTPNLVKDVDRIAKEITVRIDRSDGNNGSGVIIAQRGDTYYVLTADHVVKYEAQKYEVTTVDGRCYPVNYGTVKRLPGVDLAVLQFTSNQTYQVATLGNYDLGREGRFVFISGWAGSTQGSNEKPRRLLTVGHGSSEEVKFFFLKDSGSLTDGYELVYNNITAGGMSGGAVLDTRGRVIGIHGRAEGEITVDQAGQTRTIQLGDSLGILISTFLSIVSQVGIEPKLKVETTAPSPLTEQEEDLIREYLLPIGAIPKDTADAIDWLNYGNQLSRVGKFLEAFVAFNNAIRLKPDFYQAAYAMGLNMFRFPELHQQAFQFFDITTRLEPKFAPAWRLRGLVLFLLNRYQEALASYDRAIELDPTDSYLHQLRGVVLEGLKRYPDAISAYSKVIEIKP